MDDCMIETLMQKDNITKEEAIEIILNTKDYIYNIIGTSSPNESNYEITSILIKAGLGGFSLDDILRFSIEEKEDYFNPDTSFSVKCNFKDENEWQCRIEDSCNEYEHNGSSNLYTSKTDFILHAINDFLEENNFEGD